MRKLLILTLLAVILPLTAFAQNMTINITIDGQTLSAVLVENSSTAALIERLKQGSVSDTSEDPQWWSNNLDSRSVTSWMGLCFELVCLMHKQQIKRALGLAVVSTSIAAWRQPRKEGEHAGAQIDLIIERADRIIHLCEMKFSANEYRITEEYEQKLRHRMTLFDEATNTRKTLVNTFVTTFGVADGKHKSIVHSEVTMDDLFKD